MTNPTTPFSFISFDPDRDATKLDQDFEALMAWCTTQAVHQHHVQTVKANLPAILAGAASNVVGLVWPQAFAAGVVPYVYAQANDPAGPATGVAGIIYFPFNVSVTGCDVRCFNTSATNSVALTNGLTVIAFDPTFNVSQ